MLKKKPKMLIVLVTFSLEIRMALLTTSLCVEKVYNLMLLLVGTNSESGVGDILRINNGTLWSCSWAIYYNRFTPF